MVPFTPAVTGAVNIQVSVSPGKNPSASVNLDYVQLTRVNTYGIELSYRTGISIISSLPGGSIVQGMGRSYGSHPINAFGAAKTAIKGVSISASGMDTCLIYGNWASSIAITNCNLTASLDQISNRMALFSFIYLLNTSGAIAVENNIFSGSHQSGIVVAGGGKAGSFTSITIKKNEIKQDSSWTNGYAIELGSWCQQFEISGNSIVPISGRGILLDELATGGFIQNGRIHDNYVEVQERPDLEYGALGLEVTASRIREESDSTIKNVQIYKNTFYAHTGAGLDWAAIGARFTVTNNQGMMNHSNLVLANNLFKAVVLDDDPSLKYQDAYSIDLARFDAGTGIIFRNNTLESNDVSLNLGGNDGINESDVTFIQNTLVKSRQGIKQIRSCDTQVRGYVGIEAGNYGSTMSNIRLIDMKYAGGATSAINFIGAGAKSISFGSLLNLTVTDNGGKPLSGAAVTIQDQNGNQVFSGTTNSQGKISAIPLITATVSVPAGGNNTNPRTLTTTQFTVQGTSGGRRQSQTIQVTGDLDQTVRLR